MSYYIRTYENFFDADMCDAYVHAFEETMEKDGEEVKNTSICTGVVRPDGHQICGTCNCQRMNPMGFSRFDNLNKNALSKFQDALEIYKEDVDLNPNAWPPKFGWEEFRMKRFLVSDGGKDAEQFTNHVDVKSREGSKRFLILMVYLNDDFGEGETEFPTYGVKVRPEKGKLIMFPPMWQYMHRGNPPVAPGYAKYFLMTYLNYIDEFRPTVPDYM